MDIQELSLVLVTLAYVISAGAYAANFHAKSELRGNIATRGLVLGWVLHTFLLGRLTVAGAGVPLTNEVLPSLCAWLVVIVYFYLELTTRDRSLGALVVPIVTLLQLFTLIKLMALGEVPPVAFAGSWFKLHVLAYIGAYAAFAISCVSAVMYVLLLGEIQAKHLGFFYERLPPLETLDQINNRAVTFGFLFLVAGLIASSAWAYQELERLWVWNEPAFAALLVTCFVYACHLGVRLIAGWRGKRSAFLSIIGFALVVLSFPVVGVLFSGRHSLGQ